MTGPINPFSGLLSKYIAQIDTVDNERLSICQTIKEITGITLEGDSFEIRDSILYIKAHTAKKQVIFFKKNDILFALQSLSIKKIVDIK